MRKNCPESGTLLEIRLMAVHLRERIQFLWFKAMSYHIDNITRILISKPGENKRWVFCYTELTTGTCEVTFSGSPQCGGGSGVHRSRGYNKNFSLCSPTTHSLQKLSSLCYLVSVTLLPLNWHGFKSWEVWVDSWAYLSLFNKMSLY